MIFPEILTPLDATLVSSVSDASASVSSPTVTVVESSARLIFTALLSS